MRKACFHMLWCVREIGKTYKWWNIKEEGNIKIRNCERQFSNVEGSLEGLMKDKGDENVPDDRQATDSKCSLFFLES